jgi:hypothetical protein
MNLIGMMLARDEAWCIGLTARVALQWCDSLVVLDHRSTDATPELLGQIASEHPGRVHVIHERDKPFNEAMMRQEMLERARGLGMTHGAIIDADEVLTANLVGSVRGFAERARPGEIPHIPMRSPQDGLHQHRVDAAYSDKWISIWFKDGPEVGYRCEHDGYHYHARRPRGLRETFMPLEKFGHEGGCWHLQSISQRRLRVKSACYKALERVHYPGRHSAEELRRMYDWPFVNPPCVEAAPACWWAGYRDLAERCLDIGAEPWQLVELRRLLSENSPELFSDLDLHAVA